MLLVESNSWTPSDTPAVVTEASCALDIGGRLTNLPPTHLAVAAPRRLVSSPIFHLSLHAAGGRFGIRCVYCGLGCRVARPATEGLLGRSQDLILPVAIIASVLVIMVPLPAALMDVLLAGEYHGRRARAADDDLRAHAAGVQRVSVDAAGDDAGAAGAQRGDDAADSHAGRSGRR